MKAKNINVTITTIQIVFYYLISKTDINTEIDKIKGQVDSNSTLGGQGEKDELTIEAWPVYRGKSRGQTLLEVMQRICTQERV